MWVSFCRLSRWFYRFLTGCWLPLKVLSDWTHPPLYWCYIHKHTADQGWLIVWTCGNQLRLLFWYVVSSEELLIQPRQSFLRLWDQIWLNYGEFPRIKPLQRSNLMLFHRLGVADADLPLKSVSSCGLRRMLWFSTSSVNLSYWFRRWGGSFYVKTRRFLQFAFRIALEHNRWSILIVIRLQNQSLQS